MLPRTAGIIPPSINGEKMSNPINEEESKLLYEEFFKKDTAMATIFGLEVLSAMNEEIGRAHV